MAQTYDGSIRINTKIDQTGFQKGVNGLGAQLRSLAKLVGAAFGVAKIVAFGKEAISLASDLEEVQNVVETAFGSMTDQVNAWAKNSIEQFGMSELAAKRMASTYMSMSMGSGLQGQNAADMAVKTAERAADISSFYNKTLEESDTMLKSIWTGETESLKQIGVVMTQTNLDAYALANGFGKTTSQMTQSEQIMLRYRYVMAQTRLAAGDFAKTQGSWANQTRILSEQWKQFLSIMGQGLIQVLTPALQFLNSFMSVLIGWAQAFSGVVSALFGTQASAAGSAQSAMAGASASAGGLAASTESASDAQQDLADSAKAANSELQKQSASFDEMNILQSDTPSSSGSSGSSSGGASGGGVSVPALSGAIGSGISVSPDLQSTIDTVQAWFSDVQAAAQPTVEAVGRLWEALQTLGGFVWDGLRDFYEVFLVPLGKWTLGEGIPRFLDAITGGIEQIDWEKLSGSFHDLWISLEPFAENVGEGLLWLWEEILVPLGTWTLNDAVPSFLDLLAAGVDTVSGAIDAGKEVLQWLWENFLSPIASWVGDTAVSTIDSLTGILQSLGDWASTHGAETQGVLVGIGTAIAGWNLAGSFKQIKSFAQDASAAFSLLSEVHSFDDLKNLVETVFPSLTESLKNLDLSKLTSMVGFAAGIGILAGSIYYLVTQWDSLSPAMKTAGIALAALGAAIAVVSAAWSLFGANLLASPITWVVLGITALVAAFSLLWENCEGFRNFWIGLWEGIKDAAQAVADWFVKAWQDVSDFFSGLWESITKWATDAWDSICGAFQAAGEWFSGIFQGAAEGIQQAWAGVTGFFTGIWSGIKSAFSAVGSWFSSIFSSAWRSIQRVWSGVTGFFSGIWSGIKNAFGSVAGWFQNVFSKAWEAVKNVFSTGGKIFDGIKDGIVTAFKSVVNAIIRGINKVIAVPFNSINGILNWIRGIDILGFKPFEGLWAYNPLSVPKIPQLAKGAVIPPNREFLALLGDQKRGTNIEAPLSTIEQAVSNVLSKSSQTGPVTIVLQVGTQRLGSVVLKSLRDAAQESGGLALNLG